jgi:hypothetical protein
MRRRITTLSAIALVVLVVIASTATIRYVRRSRTKPLFWHHVYSKTEYNNEWTGAPVYLGPSNLLLVDLTKAGDGIYVIDLTSNDIHQMQNYNYLDATTPPQLINKVADGGLVAQRYQVLFTSTRKVPVYVLWAIRVD